MFRANISSTPPPHEEGATEIDETHQVKSLTKRTQPRFLVLVLVAMVAFGFTVGYAISTMTMVDTSNFRKTRIRPNSSYPERDQDQVSLQPDERASKRFAYMFYVTSDTYACAAMQFIHRLTDDLQMNSTSIDVVVMHTSRVREHLILRMQTDQRVRSILVKPLYSKAGDRTWRESLTKLRTFQDWGYERVIFLDADAVPMANLDHLFDLPKAPLYAPTAYWLEQPFFASTVLVIEPSETTFNGIVQWAHDRGAAAGFDMDILNAYFADSVQHLSGVYTVLNSDFRQAPSSGNKLFSTTTELKEHVQVVHFSCKPDGSYGKPWDWPSHDLSLLEGKDFDPLFGKLFVDFWHGKETLCAR